MATRRMISKDIVRNDLFLSMDLSTQALYFQLVLEGDDDGFVSNANSLVRMIGADKTDLEILISNGLVISFDSGVIVIKDWRIQNVISPSKKNETIHKNEVNQLGINENKSYYKLDKNE